MIEEYINFSKKINILSKKIPVLKDIKYNIWKFYKKIMYANKINEIIKKYLIKLNTEIECYDCGKKVKFKYLKETLCDNDGFWFGITDNVKYICKDGCEFKLDCGCNFKSKFYNHTEKYLVCNCTKCNKNFNKKLYWIDN